MKEDDDRINSAPVAVQFLAICYVGFGLMLIVFPWIAPVYIGFNWLWLICSIFLVFTGWRAMKMGIRISKAPTPFLYWLSIAFFALLLVAISQYVWRAFEHYPSEQQLLETKAQYQVARIYLNIVLGAGILAIWTQLFRRKVKEYFFQN